MTQYNAKHELPSRHRWKVGWGFTAKCNMGCPFCYSRDTRRKGAPSPEQNLAICTAFIEQNAEAIESINWGTGENALDDKWWLLIQRIRDRHPCILQAVTTNGFLGHECHTSPARRDLFIRCIDDVDVSLDFADAERHNTLRAHQRAFGWAITTMETCGTTGKPCSIVMLGCEETLTKKNLDGVFGLANQYGCCVRINILRPTEGVRMTPPAYDTVKLAVCHIIHNHAVVSLADPLFAGLFGREAKDASGVSSLRILPDGNITPSTYLVEAPWIAGSIADGKSFALSDLTQRDAFLGLADSHIPSGCQDCPIREVCRGGAKDRRVLWYGTLAERDPYCPTRHDNDTQWGTSGILRSAVTNGPFVHDGYLPTLIFQPLGLAGNRRHI